MSQIKVSELRDRRLERVYGISMFLMCIHFGFIVYDFYRLLLGMDALTHQQEFAMGMINNLYFVVLGGYVGAKEFRRWAHRNEEAFINESRAKHFGRGEVIVSMWILLDLIVIVILFLGLISRSPKGLHVTTLQVFGLVIGTSVSKRFLSARGIRRREEQNLKDSLEAEVVSYIVKNSSISNEECQQNFNLGRGQAYRLLKRLKKDKVIRSEGAGRGIKYVLHGDK